MGRFGCFGLVVLCIPLCRYLPANAQAGELDEDKLFAAFVEETKEIWFVEKSKNLTTIMVEEDKDPVSVTEE